MDLLDDDEKKKKPKKSKKGKKGKNKKQIPRDRGYYEQTIIDLNGYLVSLRKRFVHKDEDNQKLLKELVSIEDDRVEVCEHLKRVLAKRKIEKRELDETFTKLEKEYAEYKTYSRERIEELKKQYAEGHRHLSGEIELLTTALRSLDEFRVERDAALSQYETHHNGVIELGRQIQEDLYNMEQKAVVQKNMLKKEIQTKLQQVSGDFLHSNEIRNAGYTRNLIRENIALQKTLDRQIKANIRSSEEYEKQSLRHIEIAESYASLKQFSSQLSFTIKNKDEIIQRLTASTERLRSKNTELLRYRYFCENIDAAGHQTQFAHVLHDVSAHMTELSRQNAAIQLRQHVQELKKRRLNNVLNKLSLAINVAIDETQPQVKLPTVAETSSSIELSKSEIAFAQALKRESLITELIGVICDTGGLLNEEKEVLSKSLSRLLSSPSTTSQLYVPGNCGFIRKKQQKDFITHFETEFKQNLHTEAKALGSLYGSKSDLYFTAVSPSSKASKSQCLVKTDIENLETAHKLLKLNSGKDLITNAKLTEKCIPSEIDLCHLS